MRTNAVRLALALLVASVAFALWARERASHRGPERSRSGASVNPVEEKAKPRDAPTRPRAVGEYSFDERPCSIVGRVAWEPEVRSEKVHGQVDLPMLELRRADGREFPVPVTMTGFFGVGGLDAGEWTLACRLREHWEEARTLRFEPNDARNGEQIELARHPRLALTLSHPAGRAPRKGTFLEREAWLDDAWIVATREEPGERVAEEPVSRERLAAWMPGVRDEVAGARRTLLFDGPIAQRLTDGGWLAFAVGGRIVGSRQVERSDSKVVFEFDETQLARALGGLALRVLDAEHGAPVRGARVEFWRMDWPGCKPFAIGYPDAQEVEGGVALPRLVTGPVTVVVGAPGRERKVVAIDVQAGKTSSVDVRLAAGTSASGTAVSAEGSDLALALELVPFDGDDRMVRVRSARSGASSPDGRFHFGDLSPALWVVRSRDARFVFNPQLVDTRSGAELGVRLEARVGTQVRFLAQPGAWGRAGDRLELRDERGFVVFEVDGGVTGGTSALPLLPGRYALRFSRADGSEAAREVVVGSEPLTLQLE